MTAGELIEALKALGEKNLDKEVIMFDGPSYYTPYKVEVMDKTWGKKLLDQHILRLHNRHFICISYLF